MLNSEKLVKLVIGAAQFGSNYGITNKSQISNQDINAIIKLAKKKHINYIDTSPDYPGSQKILGSCNIKKFNIITKLPIFKNNKTISLKNVVALLEDSKKELKKKNFEALLLRTPTKLINSNLDWKKLIKLKEKQSISKLGYTIYNPDELKLIYKKYKPDVIQLPFNIFDRRFDETGWLDRLSNDGIEIHVRSVFLQGLLLLDPKSFPNKLEAKKDIFILYNNWLKDNNYSKLQSCLSLPLTDNRISKVLVGLNSFSHFKEIISTSVKEINYPKWMSKIDASIINPQSWK